MGDSGLGEEERVGDCDLEGAGTTFHGFADKMMGLKAALHSIPGNPIIVNADATDVLLQCGPEEFQKRFEQADADFIFGGDPVMAGDWEIFRHGRRATV